MPREERRIDRMWNSSSEERRERKEKKRNLLFELLLEEDGEKRNLSRERKAFCTSATTLCIYCPALHMH